MKLTKIAAIAAAPLILLGLSSAQTTEGARNFNASTSTQVVNVNQGSSGYALKATTPSTGPVGAVYGQATGSTGFNNGVWGRTFSSAGVGARGESMNSGGGTGVAGFSSGNNGIGVFGQNTFTANQGPSKPVGVEGVISNSFWGAAGIFENRVGCCAGDVIIGRSGYYGGLQNIFRVNLGGQVFATGYYTGGADFAESVATRKHAKYQPGDVLAIDASADRRVSISREPYSTLVAGIYSTKPGVVASPYRDGKLPSAQVPLAVVGIVPTKVTAANGAIHRGDLLVSSSKPGYAMKGTDRTRMVGAVLGKALQPLPKGDGVIQVLVTLQ